MKRILLVLLLILAAGPRPVSAQYTPDANVERSAVPARYRWKLDVLFPNEAAFQKALADAAAGRQRLAAYQGTLARAERLLACMQEYFALRSLTDRINMYAHLRLDTAQQDATLQADNDRALAAGKQLMAVASFIRGEVLRIDAPTLERAYAAQPKLGRYRPYLREMRRRRAHVLDAGRERLLAMAGDNQFSESDLNELPSGFEKTFRALLADLQLPRIHDEKGKEVQLTLSNYPKYRASNDRRVRQETVESFFGTLKAYRHAFAAAYAGQVDFTIFLARARGYKSSLDAYLDRDNINPSVYRSLIRAIHANVAPLHRYMKMRKKLMGVDALHLYDLYTPLVKSVRREISYDEARQVVPEALAPLGEKYLAVLRQGLDPASGWVDVYPHKDKDSGAFCSSMYGVHPFVKLNYFNESDDVSTLAHEFGHAMHSHLSNTHQPEVTAGYVPFLAEIASTCNEKLLNDYLAAHAKSDDEKLYVLNDMVDRIRTTIYRQALFAEFELAVHAAAEKGTPVTAEFLDKTYADLIRTYYGPDFTVGANDDVEWAYIPHLYYKFYVYGYATGLSSGIAIAEKITKEGAPARDAYLGMLSAGSSKPPLEILKGAGVDLTKPYAIEAAAKLMDRILGQMEAILARRDHAEGGK